MKGAEYRARLAVRRHFATYIANADGGLEGGDLAGTTADDVNEIWTDECQRIAEKLDPSRRQ